VLYLLSAGFLVGFLGGFGLLLLIYLVKRHDSPALPDINTDQLPTVTVQLPIYNEARVVERLLDACTRLVYPAGKLHIQILDDSTDETAHIIQGWLRKTRDGRLSYLHREDRVGYKAGALQHGLEQTDSEFVVVFDADFVPPADFLLKTMPYFIENPQLGLIQTRWSHLNGEYNLLTRAQALSIDAHFGVEQVARNRGGLPMAMNGTGGIWRTDTIRDAGGWAADTLTEDLDLSYRAYLRGWDFLFLPDVHAPGEIPPFVPVFKMQQARWAAGSTQSLFKIGWKLLTSRRPSPLAKVMGLLHLCQYIVQPMILLLFLLTPLLLASGGFDRMPNLSILAIAGLIPPIIVAVAQLDLYENGWKKLIFFPVQFVVSAAVVVNNSAAVLTASLPHNKQFRRTPKFRLTKEHRSRRNATSGLETDATTIIELLLATYALWGATIALNTQPTLVPYMLSYALSFSIFAISTLVQVRSQRLGPQREGQVTRRKVTVRHPSTGLD